MLIKHCSMRLPRKLTNLFCNQVLPPVSSHFLISLISFYSVPTWLVRLVCHRRLEMRVSRYRDLSEGDVLSFFYPSTERHMAGSFTRFCKEPTCLGEIVGAG